MSLALGETGISSPPANASQSSIEKACAMHGNGVVKVNHRRRSRLAAGFLLRAVHKREEGAACATAHGRGAETFPTLFEFDSVLGSIVLSTTCLG